MLHRWVKEYESGKLGEVSQGYAVTLVLPLVKIPRSTYYYFKSEKVIEKTASEGRPAPGYSYQTNGTKVSDEQIQELSLPFYAHTSETCYVSARTGS
jgi:hypothetical protein